MTIDGTQHNLGPDREKAIERYHAPMTQPRPKKVAADSVAESLSKTGARDRCFPTPAKSAPERDGCRYLCCLMPATGNGRGSQGGAMLPAGSHLDLPSPSARARRSRAVDRFFADLGDAPFPVALEGAGPAGYIV